MRRWIIAFIVGLILALVTKGLWTWEPSDLNNNSGASAAETSQSQSLGSPQIQTVSDELEVPANGYVSNGKCYVVIGQGGLSVEQPCSSFKKVPEKIRQCVGSTLLGAFVGWLTGGTLGASAAGSAVGCVEF
jgi:hypothetical protein